VINEDEVVEQAIALADAGMVEEADALIERPPAPVVALPPAAARPSGIGYRPKWTVDENVDLEALVAAAAKDPQYLAFLSPNMTALRKAAEAQKEYFRVPGCRAVRSTTVAAGRGR
jgi:hypothetical protein